MVWKLSVRCLRSSYRRHHWLLYLPTTVSGTDLVSYSVMVSGTAITTEVIFSFFCNAPPGVKLCKRNEVLSCSLAVPKVVYEKGGEGLLTGACSDRTG